MFARKWDIAFLLLSVMYKIDGMNKDTTNKCLCVARYLARHPDGENDNEKRSITAFFNSGSDVSRRVSEYQTILSKILPGMMCLIPDVKNMVYRNFLRPDIENYFVRQSYLSLAEGVGNIVKLSREKIGTMSSHEILKSAGESTRILCNTSKQNKKEIKKAMDELGVSCDNDIDVEMGHIETILKAIAECHIDLLSDHKKGPKDSIKQFMFSLTHILRGSRSDVQFITSLVRSNDQGKQLLKFTPDLVKKWKKLDLTVRQDLGGLKLDVQSESETFIDNAIRHGPLIAATIMPDIFWYHLDHITDFIGISPLVTKYVCFVAGIYASKEIGHDLVPILDASFHSHVKLLKTFFGDNVRTRIRRGYSFMFFSFFQSILSYTANCLLFTQTIPGVTVAMALYFLRILTYEIMNQHLWYENPIERGAPNKAEYIRIGDRDNASQPYTLKHLKVS